MPEVLYREYRQYVANRVNVNNAMMALLAGSRLAAHTLQLTAGSDALLARVFPAVEHIERFNLRTDSARALLEDADRHVASVAIPYALATHEDFVMAMLDLLTSEGIQLVRHGKRVSAWNMQAVLFETCRQPEPQEWMQAFHVLREARNCIIHAGGVVSADLVDRIAGMGSDARSRWRHLNGGDEPEALEAADGRLALTAAHVFTAFAVTKRLGREVNRALVTRLNADSWARIAVHDYMTITSKTRNSSGWRRSLLGYAAKYYAQAALQDADLEAAARQVGAWTTRRWE